MHGRTADAVTPKEDGEGWPSPLSGCPLLQHISFYAQLCSIFFLLEKVVPIFKVFSSSAL